MKTLYLIGGTMGVGKTTVCRMLKDKLDRSVFLDGDWCWDMHPFTVTEETKRMVMDNICFLLSRFVACSEYEHILFCWVMHEQAIIDEILSRVPHEGCAVKRISLTCTKDALCRRLQKDVDAGVRAPEIIERSAARLALYARLDTIKIDVSALSPKEIMERILRAE